MTTIIHQAAVRRSKRVRGKLSQNISLPRLTVYRSNQHLWVQIIDDRHSKTICSGATKLITTKGTKTEKAVLLGQQIAKKAMEQKVIRIRFDRGPYKYHGRVKALADSARASGLKF